MDATFRDVVELTPEFVQSASADGGLLYANPSWLERFGYTAGEITRLTLADTIEPSSLQHYLAAVRTALSGETVPLLRARFRAKGGHPFDVEGSLVAQFENGQPAIVHGIFREVTADRYVEEEHQRFSDLSHDLLAIVSPSGYLLRLNPAWERTLGYSEEELKATALASFIHPDDVRVSVEGTARLARAERASASFEVRMRTAQGEYRWLAWRAVRSDETGLIYAIARDVTEQKARDAALEAASAEIARLARKDAVTGLPNRLSALEYVGELVAVPPNNGDGFAILFIDLDRFKDVNDSLGHAVGDEFLRLVAAALGSSVRGTDFVARLGGDEFLVVLHPHVRRAEAQAIAGRLLRTVAEPLEVRGHHLYQTASIGVAVFPDDGTDAESLMRRADTAMYGAKRGGRNAVLCFEPAMDAEVSARAEMTAALHQAFERGEFFLEFQPIVSVSSRTLSALEALIRWQRLGVGRMLPNAFLSAIEDAGLALRLDQWVVKTALRQFAEWRSAGAVPDDTRVTVNVSAAHVVQAGFPTYVLSCLAEAHIPSSLLEIELTERALLHDRTAAFDGLQRLRRAGVRLAIDDFGTGYSSLSYLRLIPLSTVKLDRSFLHEVTEDETSRTLVENLVSLVHALGLHVVAEGVETPEQLAILASAGCDAVQGFLLGEPAPTVPALAQWPMDLMEKISR